MEISSNNPRVHIIIIDRGEQTITLYFIRARVRVRVAGVYFSQGYYTNFIIIISDLLSSESQIRVRSDGRGRNGDVGRTVDHGAASTHMQVPGDRRREVRENWFVVYFCIRNDMFKGRRDWKDGRTIDIAGCCKTLIVSL